MQSRNFFPNTRALHRLLLIVSTGLWLAGCQAPDETSRSAPMPSGASGTIHSPSTTTVSGVSSGGYMAVQTHIALSDKVSGAGIVAGGPYHCAAGSVVNALGRCLSGDDLDVVALVSFARAAAASDGIAATENLNAARVWIFHSGKDQVVSKKVSAALAAFYEEFVQAEQIRMVDNIDAAHGWPTLDAGSECLQMSGDFINACDFDTAGNLLNHLYADLRPRNTGQPNAQVSGIDLSSYVGTGSGMADSGFVFVPVECREADAACRLHIAFHGCRQGAEFVNDQFAIQAGFNEWAEANRIVVMYPQIISSTFNPQGCWDWWGYTGEQYDQRTGKQIAAVDAIITAFSTGKLLTKTADPNPRVN